MNKESETTRVIAFDPALSCTGWSVIDHKHDNKGIKSPYAIVRFGTLKPASLADRVINNEHVDMYGRRLTTLIILRDAITELLTEYNPDYIVVEDAFYNPKRPTAYAALLQWICVIELLCKDVFNKPIYKVPTRSAKQCITGSGGSHKTPVRDAVLNNSEIVFRQRKYAEGIGDHETDSIAVGYFFLKEILPVLTIT